ncbi:MAG TPA: hypothetical protein VF718_05550 [Allosphingosinicella sp.]|jgi:hypothetical protein
MSGDNSSPSTPAATSAVSQSHEAGPAEAASAGAAADEGVGTAFHLGSGFSGDPVQARSYERHKGDPIYRPLKIYTVDPVRRRLEGAVATINVPYEPLEPGPVGRRFEVVGDPNGPLGRYEPGSQAPGCYEVDLEDRRILIRSGREPAPSDPVFHHQMVYAVATSTYSAFRVALGREIVWSFGRPRLTLYPHGVAGERRAFYDSRSAEVRFGWYDAGCEVAGRVPPKGRIFLCLSHDVVAHEVTHALLDGLRARFDFDAHKEINAFHEAFADLIAVLQRFSYSEVVKDALRRTGGDFHEDPSFLRFGFQFAQSEGKYVEREPDLGDAPARFNADLETYEMGTILLSAILEALFRVYKRKAEPLMRLATGGSGLFPRGAALPGDLIDQLAHLASRLASHFLSICIRAIDYCPPVGIDFGEYLRALVTADFELVPDDPWGYREALIDAFIRRGIYPRGVESLSEDALLWRAPEGDELVEPQLHFAELKFSGDPASPASAEELRRQAAILGRFITAPERLGQFGLAAPDDPRLEGDKVDLPRVESIRSSRRVGPDGQIVFDLVAEVIQRRQVAGGSGQPGFDFYGGSTIILGPRGEVRYVVSKSIRDSAQIERLRAYLDSKNEYPEE